MVLFILAHRHMRKTLVHTVIDRKQKQLFQLKTLTLVLATLLFLGVLNICWAIYSQGLEDIWTVFCYATYTFVYECIEIIIFIMLTSLNMDWKLQTQIQN